MIHRLVFQLPVALLPSMKTDDANDDFYDVTKFDAIDDDANENVHFSNLSNLLKAVTRAVILAILLLSTHHLMLLIFKKIKV